MKSVRTIWMGWYICIQLVFQLFCLPLSGQNSGEIDTEDILQRNQEHRDLYRKSPDEALLMIRGVLKDSRKAEFGRGIALAYTGLGHSMKGVGEMDSAVFYYRQAIEAYESIDMKEAAGLQYYNLGLIFKQLSKSDSALAIFLRGLNTYQASEIGRAKGLLKNSLGNLYHQMEKEELAEQELKEAISVWGALQDSSGLADSYTNLGIFYTSQDKWQEAHQNYGRAIRLYEEQQDLYGLQNVKINQGNAYLEEGKYAKAKENFEECLEIRTQFGDSVFLAMAYSNFGALFYEQKQYLIALGYLEQAYGLVQGKKLYEVSEKIHLNLANAYQVLNQPGPALFHHRLYAAARDSVQAEANQQYVERLATEYEVEQTKLREENATLQLEQEKRRSLFGAFIGGGIILLLLAIYFYTRFQSSRKTLQLREKEFLLQQEQQQTAQLQELDQFKSRFFADISHEFRTPLTLILGPAENLWQKSQDTASRQQVDLIRRNANRVLRLVNQLLDLSRLENGRVELQKVGGDLIAFLRRITMTFSFIAQQNGIELKFDSEIPPRTIYFDPDKVEKVLINLLSNAFRFTPKGGSIEVHVRQKSERELAISVTDNGMGIEADQLPHVFERFYQASNKDLTTHHPSSGIGLALSKELVELHGGNIHVQSTPGLGTVFQFTLPNENLEETTVSQVEEKRSPEVVVTLPEIFVEEDSPEEEKQIPALPVILLIEDNADIRTFLRTCLAGQYQLMEAEDGVEGIEMALQHIPDLIITDVMMPYKDGFEVVRELKQHELTNHIPVIILTGKSSRKSKLEGLETEAEEFLIKPFDAEELLVRIQGLLRNRARLQEKFSRRLFLEASQVEVSSKEEVFLNKAIAVVEANLGNENFRIEQLARELNQDRTQVYRKLKALTDLSPSRFIRSIRLRRARQLIEGRAGTIAEIAYSVGFNSPTYFSKCFKEQFGVSPKEVLGIES